MKKKAPAPNAQAPRAQGAIEYLLIIGAAILVVTVVVIALTSILQASGEQTNEDSVLDTQLVLLAMSNSAKTEELGTLTIAPSGVYEKVLSGPIYVNSSSIAQTQNDLKNAYYAGIYIVKIEGKSAKDLGYSYNISGTLLDKELKITYNTWTGKFTLLINYEGTENLTGKTKISYIDFANSGKTTKSYPAINLS